MSEEEKKENLNLIINNESYSLDEQKQILNYCQKDVEQTSDTDILADRGHGHPTQRLQPRARRRDDLGRQEHGPAAPAQIRHPRRAQALRRGDGRRR